MGVSNPHNIGAHVKLAPLSIPQAIPAGAVNPNTAGKTLVIDRRAVNDPKSMALLLNCGQTSSNPSVATMQAQLFDSPDGTTFTAYVPPPKNGVAQTDAKTAVVDCSAGPGSTELDIDLTGADRYVSVKLIPAFTGGTTPAIEVSVAACFGGCVVEPV